MKLSALAQNVVNTIFTHKFWVLCLCWHCANCGTLVLMRLFQLENRMSLWTPSEAWVVRVFTLQYKLLILSWDELVRDVLGLLTLNELWRACNPSAFSLKVSRNRSCFQVRSSVIPVSTDSLCVIHCCWRKLRIFWFGCVYIQGQYDYLCGRKQCLSVCPNFHKWEAALTPSTMLHNSGCGMVLLWTFLRWTWLE